MVLAQSKRRRWSLLSLPIVVAAGFLVVAKLAAWQQSDLVKELEDCIAHGETREAIDAVHKLAAMPSPPIGVLVTAAAADEHETAEAGQVAISRLLRRWQRELESQHHVSTVGGQLTELAQALAEQLSEFSPADHVWLSNTAGKILRLANTFPPKQTPLVAIHCDLIMATIGKDGLASPSSAITETKSKSLERTTALSNSKIAIGPAANESIPYATQAFQTGTSLNEPLNDNDANILRAPRQTLPAARSELIFNSDVNAAGTSSNHLSASAEPNGIGVTDDGAPQPVSPRLQPEWRSDWAQPMYRIVPAMPADVAPTKNGESTITAQNSDSASPNIGVASGEPFARLDSRELLRYWLAQEDSESFLLNASANGSGPFFPATAVGAIVAGLPLESELTSRGFGRVTTGIVRQFFSGDPELRIRTLEHVLAQPGAGSGAWLLLLADDPNADVRLFAVTLMTTSSDAALVEKAWQIALRDRDPRISDLADRLRERRVGTLRR